jgi:hypothetical protein
MKKTILITFLLTLLNLVFCQSDLKISGKWQAETAQITSMHFDTYNFSKNGSFNFSPNAYNGLNRIISIIGKYEIKADTLILIPEYTSEILGGYFVRSEVTTLSDTWEIIGGHLKTIPCKIKKLQTAIFRMDPKEKTIKIDNIKYFLLDER